MVLAVASELVQMLHLVHARLQSVVSRHVDGRDFVEDI